MEKYKEGDMISMNGKVGIYIGPSKQEGKANIFFFGIGDTVVDENSIELVMNGKRVVS